MSKNILYQYETSSGMQWKPSGNVNVQPKYEGEIKNGIMEGLGVLTYPYDGKIIVTITHPHQLLIPDPNNKVLHSFYKLHIVRDHVQRQSEMTGHNKYKLFL